MYIVRREFRIVIIALLAFALLCISIPIWMRLDMRSFTYTSFQDVPKTQVAIVLGASVVNGKPSPILAARTDAAIELYEMGKVSKILVTGDNGTLSHDEVNPVQRYLLAAGIPPQDIFLDHAGFDTYSSMYRAIAVFHATSATIVTQDFHLPRSLFLARHLGLQAYGVVANGQGTPLDYMREIPASDKALWDIMINRLPQYLGTPFPLTGSGTSTWY
ncbi:MAG TPA: ElyC/SanA/YdcF family protein [Candidatus Paceibacterota bacterium]|nr:ElyC/SanA/YdcF family protein [Candidatus Paceibacterota bacterium]